MEKCERSFHKFSREWEEERKKIMKKHLIEEAAKLILIYVQRFSFFAKDFRG